MKEVISYLIDVNSGHKFDKAWSEGFVIGLNYAKAISGDELEDLLAWISNRVITPEMEVKVLSMFDETLKKYNITKDEFLDKLKKATE